MRISPQIVFPCICVALPVAPAAAQHSPLADYDHTVPFQYQEEPVEKDNQIEVAGAGFQSPMGGKVNMLVVRPRGAGPYAAIVYQHGGGQSMPTYLAEAEVLARAGAVSLILDVPGSGPGKRTALEDKGAEMRASYAEMAVCFRRAVDYLQSLQIVDPSRMAFVGHSYGAIAGSVLVRTERRIKTFVLIGGVARLSRHVSETQIDYWIEWRKGMTAGQLAHAVEQIRPIDPDNFVSAPGHGSILVQCGSFDSVNIEACPALYSAASNPKELRWYDTDHGFADLEATFDRMQWLQRELRLNAVEALLNQLWKSPKKRTTAIELK